MWCWLLLLFYLTRGFSSIAFRRHAAVSYRQVFTPILYFQLSSSQSGSRHFHLNLSGLFRDRLLYHECYGFERTFFKHRRSLPCTPFSHFGTFCGSDVGKNTHAGSSSVPALIKLSLPTDAWSWTTHIVDARPLVYQLRQWATKYRVKTLFIMFQRTYACLKLDEKTIKTLWIRLVNKYTFFHNRRACQPQIYAVYIKLKLCVCNNLCFKSLEYCHGK